MLLIHSLDMVRLPVLSPLKKTGSSPTPNPYKKPSAVESYTSFNILITILRTLLHGFLSRLLLFSLGEGGMGVEVVPEACESEVINATVKVASLPFTVSESRDHGLPHGFWQQHKPRMPTWSPVAVSTSNRPQHGVWAVQTVSINRALCFSAAHGHPSAWPLVEAPATVYAPFLKELQDNHCCSEHHKSFQRKGLLSTEI